MSRRSRTSHITAFLLLAALLAPPPVLALRPAGLEESNTRSALLKQLSEASRLRSLEDLRVPAAALRRHPGGPIESFDALREFLQARGVAGSWTDDHLRVVADEENIQRQRENFTLRETNQPPRLLLAWNQRLRMVNYLQQYASGALPLKTLADAMGYATIFSLYPRHGQSDFDFHEIVTADNALRLDANVARRAADLPLLSLTVVGRDADTALLDVLQQFRGGYLPMKELAGGAGVTLVHANRLGWLASDDDGHVAAENARRERANALRRTLGKPPVPRVAHDSTTALQYALEDWWNAEPPTQKQIIELANISSGQFDRHFEAALPVANVTRAAHDLPPLPAALAGGLEESNDRSVPAGTLMNPERAAARQRVITSLRQHPGGRTTTVELARAAGMSRRYWYQLGGLALLDAENTGRLEENVVRRANDQPLRPPIIPRQGRGYNARAALQEVLQQASGYFLPPGEAARQAGVSIGQTGEARSGYTTLVPDESARRQRTNALRRVLGKPPVPRIGATILEAAAFVLEDQPGGLFPSKELASAVGVSESAVRPSRVRSLYEAENARRVLERESRQRWGRPWRRLALTVEETIQFAIEDHPGGSVTAYEFADFAGVRVRALWELGHRSGGTGYRQRIDAQNALRAAGLAVGSPIVIVPKPYTSVLYSGPRRAAVATNAGLEEISAARWRALAAQATEPRGLVVIPAQALKSGSGLVALLMELGDDFAPQVLLWLETDVTRAIEQYRAAHGQEPIRVLRRGEAVGDLINDVCRYLEERGLERVGLLTDDGAMVREFAVRLDAARTRDGAADVPVVRLSGFSLLTAILKVLGVPETVSQRIRLDELVSERYVGSGT